MKVSQDRYNSRKARYLDSLWVGLFLFLAFFSHSSAKLMVFLLIMSIISAYIFSAAKQKYGFLFTQVIIQASIILFVFDRFQVYSRSAEHRTGADLSQLILVFCILTLIFIYLRFKRFAEYTSNTVAIFCISLAISPIILFNNTLVCERLFANLYFMVTPLFLITVLSFKPRSVSLLTYYFVPILLTFVGGLYRSVLVNSSLIGFCNIGRV